MHVWMVLDVIHLLILFDYFQHSLFFYYLLMMLHLLLVLLRDCDQCSRLSLHSVHMRVLALVSRRPELLYLIVAGIGVTSILWWVGIALVLSGSSGT